ncbi:hypothetical protein K458DRAFT_151587 [Lentithecium fluviatile CBS 122367]|uniref:Rhodopsin domain-containing protein n=1 Tax=Lentithecium fluviatile CBS 122367 TaxID=1168545 RepID=A0A6G1JE55_9PLEO|nr:hypothetical protein K458DRAFT_151587 [Lentithecium fluviatile CBS 122367]
MSRRTFRNLEFVNNSINIATNLVFALLPLPTLGNVRVDLRTRVFLIIILSLGLISCVSSIARVLMIYDMWKGDDRLAHSARLCFWSIIEIAHGIMAACLPSLKPLLTTISNLFSNLISRQSAEPCKPEPPTNTAPPSPYAASYSTPTFLSLPRPRPTRFHDHTSDLDFDLYDSPTHRSRTHSRNPSNLTMLSNFTTFTTPHVESEGTPPRAYSKGLTELGEDMRGFKNGYAVSITSGSGETCERSEEFIGGVEDGASAVAVVGGIIRTTEVRLS